MKRRFRALRSRGPETSYDAVVIGAGVGGLVCANLLAREGLRVLLVEQHYMVGGYCSSFRRAGYTFDAATHFYPLLGNPATITGKLLAQLGVETGWVKMDPVDTVHFPDGTRFVVPADLETFRERLDAAFPHEKEALGRFFREVREAYLRGLLCYFRGYPEERLGHYRDVTVREVLDRHFHDRKLKLLLAADSPHWGTPPSRTAFAFDAMLRLSYFLGNYYPAGGSQAFADELARCFEARGGHILMSSRVERIAVRRGRACGVEVATTRGPLRGRRSIAAGAVVSNADLVQTLESMLGPQHVTARERAAVRRLRPTCPCFITHLGLRGVPAEELAAAQGYYWDGWDPDERDRGFAGKLFVPTLYEPRLAPSGGQILIVQKIFEVDHRAAHDWAAHKAAVERRVLAHLERVLPGIARRIVVKTSATARTSRRFTLNHRGAMLGWEMSPGQLGDGRPDFTGPVENLYRVGHWTRPGGGITPVIVSATRVAQLVAGAREPVPAEAVPVEVAA